MPKVLGIPMHGGSLEDAFGSQEMISINEFGRMVIRISGKTLAIKNIDRPIGVRGRTSDNALIHTALGWTPSMPLEEGMRRTYSWIAEQVRLAASRRSAALSDASLPMLSAA